MLSGVDTRLNGLHDPDFVTGLLQRQPKAAVTTVFPTCVSVPVMKTPGLSVLGRAWFYQIRLSMLYTWPEISRVVVKSIDEIGHVIERGGASQNVRVELIRVRKRVSGERRLMPTGKDRVDADVGFAEFLCRRLDQSQGPGFTRGIGRWPAPALALLRELTTVTAPPRCSENSRSPRCRQRNRPVRLTCSIRSHSAGVMRMVRRLTVVPTAHTIASSSGQTA